MRHDGLTDRQLEVACLVAQGMTDKQIGDALHITPNTVDFHVRRILDAWEIRGGNVRVLIANRVNRGTTGARSYGNS